MLRADVLIVGGGPAGSACATALADRGRDVIVLDVCVFPRDKPCAGWLTPEAVAELPIDFAEYARTRTAQPIVGFRLGKIGGRAIELRYDAPVSHGIRRVELDDAVLRGSGARVVQGHRVRTVERRNGAWVLDGAYAAPYLVGAGGHACPVARLVAGPPAAAATVVAVEAEYPLAGAAGCRVSPEVPELYFCADFLGYGWCFRKGEYLNVGLGRLDPRHLRAQLQEFLGFLVERGRIATPPRRGWRGHSYALRDGTARRLVGDRVALVGDAAALAFPASGEGIFPALVSGTLAAEAILGERLGEYPTRLAGRLGGVRTAGGPPGRLQAWLGGAALRSRPLARRLVLERRFLHGRRGRARAAFATAS